MGTSLLTGKVPSSVQMSLISHSNFPGKLPALWRKQSVSAAAPTGEAMRRTGTRVVDNAIWQINKGESE